MDSTWKHKFLLIVLGLSFGLVCSEIVLSVLDKKNAGSNFDNLADLRAAMLGDSPEPKDKRASVDLRAIVTPHLNDKIIYTLRPDTDVRFQRKPVKINSCGMRDEPKSILKSANTYRIAMLGDSFAFGWGVEKDEAFPEQLEKNLNRLSTDGTTYEVLNFGVPGYSTFQEVAIFKEEAIDFDPDAVIVFFIRNDFGFPFFVRNIEGGGGIFSSVKFLNLLGKASNTELEEQKLKLLRLDPNRALRELSNFTREHGIKLFVAINPKDGWVHDFRRLSVLKERDDVTLIQMRKNYLNTVKVNQIPEPELTLSNDPHPSAIRHKMYADLMTPYFMDIVR